MGMRNVLLDLVERADSWVNVALGFGGVSDKIKATRYGSDVRKLTDGEITAMFRTEHLSAKIVDVYPREAYREGFEVCGYDTDEEASEDGGSGGSSGDDTSKTATGTAPHPEVDVEEQVRGYLGAWKVCNIALNAAIWGRAYGGAAVWLGSHTADPAQPFVLGERIDFLRVVDRRYLQPVPWSLDALGKPTYYNVIPHEGGTPVGPIHVSRLVMFPGARTDVQTYQGNGYWDDSVLQRAYDALKSDGLVWRSAEQMISEASIGVLMIKGLYSKITGPARKQIEDRLALFNLTRSVARNMTLDKENEEYKRDNVTFAGISDLTAEGMKRVASAAEIPVAILLSDEPSGLNATGESSIRWWLMRVHAYRTGELQEPTLYLVRALLAQSGIAAVSADKVDKLAIKWPALWTPSAKEQSEIYSATASADCNYIDRGVIDASEVALSRFGEDGYSQETKIDRALREPPTEAELTAAADAATGAGGADPSKAPAEGDKGAPAAKPGEGPAGEGVQDQVLNGTQVSSLVDIVSKVAAKEIPRDAGIQIVMLSYQVDQQRAEALLGSAGTPAFEPVKPEPPAGFGGEAFGKGGGGDGDGDEKGGGKGAPFGGKAAGKGTPQGQAPTKAPPPKGE